jgi:mycoredoxin
VQRRRHGVHVPGPHRAVVGGADLRPDGDPPLARVQRGGDGPHRLGEDHRRAAVEQPVRLGVALHRHPRDHALRRGLEQLDAHALGERAARETARLVAGDVVAGGGVGHGRQPGTAGPGVARRRSPRDMLNRMRWLWLLMLAGTAFLVVDTVSEGSVATAVVYGVVGLALTWWLSPWQGGRTVGHAEATALPASERPVVIYWRPGCAYCARLRAGLGRAGRRALWVNIWQDAAAAAFVRGVNDGNETVPTVVIDGRPMTNPDPRLVRERLVAR